MITLDDRAGSGELYNLLRSRSLPIKLGRLTFGDLAFLGNGPDGCPVPIGVEVKSINDVLTCITNGRFAGTQLPGLVATYEVYWLLVEGIWRCDPSSGVLQVLKRRDWVDAGFGQRRFMYRDLQTWLLTLQQKAGLRVVTVSNWTEAAHWISTLYNWWTNKEWEEHRAHLAMDSSGGDWMLDRALLVRPTLCRRVAAQLPGIGAGKSEAVANYFGTTKAMVEASETEWRLVQGIGPKIAGSVWRALRDKR